jgi:hypothetical protein
LAHAGRECFDSINGRRMDVARHLFVAPALVVGRFFNGVAVPARNLDDNGRVPLGTH